MLTREQALAGNEFDRLEYFKQEYAQAMRGYRLLVALKAPPVEIRKAWVKLGQLRLLVRASRSEITGAGY